MKNIYTLLVGIILCSICCTSCDDDNSSESVAPVVTDFSPKESDVAEQIIITGTNFGANRQAADGHVFFNGIEAADYISYSDNQIVVTVPRGAVTGYITVRKRDQWVRATEKFSYKSSDPEDGFESGTFEKYLFCKDVVEFTGSSNPCDYVGTDGIGTALGQMGKDNTYKGNDAAGSFALWDSKPGDYTIFEVEIETPGRYYISYSTASGVANSYVNIMINKDLEALKDATVFDNAYSKDIELTAWGTYVGPYEIGSYLLIEPGTYYVRLLMLNADSSASAVGTLKLVKIFN